MAVSIGLHGLLLKLPVKTPAPLPETALIVPPESMPVTTLPAPAAAPPEPAAQNPAPAPPENAPAAVAPAAAAPAPNLLAAEPVTSEPVVSDEPITPDPVASDPVTSDPTAPLDPPAPYQDFPHLAGATAGCQGSATCWRSPAASWRSAANELKAQLESQGYTLDDVTERLLGDDTGARIYTVNRNGETAYYLNLVSVRDGILYTLAAEPITAAAIAAIDRF
ncbi:MAG TPA: hypothetical protein V6D06_00385 [Trichocoleus sp.]